jgi:hypothetical protein
MPQYELDAVGPARFSGLARGRSAEDAVRRSGGVPEAAEVALGEPDGPEAWQEVQVDGEPAGRVRAHQRMRFRRD